MGCLKLTYRQEPELKVSYLKKELTQKNSSQNVCSTPLYLFNAMENDPEVSGLGNSYTTEFRQYDPRLGRWKSLDPLMMMFPSESPYNGFGNNPIYFTDPYGLEPTNGDEGGGDGEPKGGKDKGVKYGSVECSDCSDDVFLDPVEIYSTETSNNSTASTKNESTSSSNQGEKMRISLEPPPLKPNDIGGGSDQLDRSNYQNDQPTFEEQRKMYRINKTNFVDLDPTEENNKDQINANGGDAPDQTMYSTRRNYCYFCPDYKPRKSKVPDKNTNTNTNWAIDIDIPEIEQKKYKAVNYVRVRKSLDTIYEGYTNPDIKNPYLDGETLKETSYKIYLRDK